MIVVKAKVEQIRCDLSADSAQNRQKQKRRHSNECLLFVLALPIFPGRLQPSIVGRSELNFRVRDGNGWTLALISTNCCIATASLQ